MSWDRSPIQLICRDGVIKANSLIPKDYGLIIKEIGFARMIRFDINEARKKTKQRNNYFLRNTLLDIT